MAGGVQPTPGLQLWDRYDGYHHQCAAVLVDIEAEHVVDCIYAVERLGFFFFFPNLSKERGVSTRDILFLYIDVPKLEAKEFTSGCTPSLTCLASLLVSKCVFHCCVVCFLGCKLVGH